MKRLTTILFLMLMTVGVALAQPPQPKDVVRASKGQLPTLPVVPPAQPGVVPDLTINNISIEYNSFTGSYRWCALLTFGDYAYVEESSNAYYWIQKKNAEGGWDNLATLASNAVGYSAYNPGTYRLYYREGKFAGKVSNEVEVDFPAGTSYSRTNGWSHTDYGEFPSVGNVIIRKLWCTVTTYQKDKTTKQYSVEDGYFRYQWYRNNINTGQRTRIPGATTIDYKPTLDDVGYGLILEVTGDGTHCNFLQNIPIGKVLLPVMASFEYAGDDGFILNTDYVLNANDIVLNMDFYGEDEMPQSGMDISQREPGQYVFRCKTEDYNYVTLEHANPNIYLCFVYLMEQDWDDDGEWETIDWYREAQIMADRYMQQLVVKPVYNGAPLATTVEAYTPNIDGEMTLVGTAEAVDENGATFDGLYALGRGFYVKALQTANTSETYYPSAQLWTEATPVMPGIDEDWNPLSFTIDVKPVLSALTGTGVIEGTLTVSSSASAPRRAPADAFGINVYLKKKGGDIIANEVTNAAGGYRFEKVPLGTYEVLVNIDGCTQPSPMEVTLTSSNKTAADVDYVVKNNTIMPTSQSQATGIHNVSASDSSEATFYDLQGRRIQNNNLGRGLYIQNGKKVLVK